MDVSVASTPNAYDRASFRKTTLATSTCMFPRCCPPGRYTCRTKASPKSRKALESVTPRRARVSSSKSDELILSYPEIVVAAENETLVMEAYWESAACKRKNERIKAEDRALKRWQADHGLRVRRRLQQEYGGQDLEQNQYNPLADADAAKEKGEGKAREGYHGHLAQGWRSRPIKLGRDRPRSTPEDTKPDIHESGHDPDDSRESNPDEEPTTGSEGSEEDLEEVEVPTTAPPSALAPAEHQKWHPTEDTCPWFC